MSLEALKRIVENEYTKVIDKATERYGPFTLVEVRLPRLDDEAWRDELNPPELKLYGGAYFPEKEPPFFALNVWALTREYQELGESYSREKVRRTLAHELLHFLRRGWSEIDINIETEKLLRLIP